MSAETRAPMEGDKVLFTDVRGKPPVPGVIVHVWTASCVNVSLVSGEIRTSVSLVQRWGARPSGYYCEFEPEPAVVEPAKFRFNLGSSPAIKVSGEFGLVVARAEYLNSEPSYLPQYRSNTGDAVEQWWRESALS